MINKLVSIKLLIIFLREKKGDESILRIKEKTFIHGVVTAIAIVMVLGIVAFPVSAEQNEEARIQVAADIQSAQTFKNKNTGRYINANDYLIGKPFPTTTPRYWNVKRWNDGTVELSISGSGLALDDSVKYGFRMYSRNSSKFQSWWVIRHSDGTISFQNQQTGRCIDDSQRFGLRTYPCNYSSYQRFY